MRHAENGEKLYVWGVDRDNPLDKCKVSSAYIEPSEYWEELKEQALWLNSEKDGNRYYVGSVTGEEVLPSFEDIHEAIVWDGEALSPAMKRALKIAGWWR
jgi:hypothetical protein